MSLSTHETQCIQMIEIYYTTLTNYSMKYLTMCKVYTDAGGIK